jgi:hypothetical protein
MKTIQNLVILLALTFGHQAYAMKKECLKEAASGGTVKGTSFSDTSFFPNDSEEDWKVGIIQYCQQNEVLIGIRIFLNDPFTTTDRVQLGTWGVTNRPGTCKGA